MLCAAAAVVRAAVGHGAPCFSALVGTAACRLARRCSVPPAVRVGAGASGRRGSRLARRASEEEELQALLAQAEALRREAEADEEDLKSQRGQREAEEAKEAEEAAKRAEEEAKRAREDAERRSLVASAKLSIAEGKLRKAEADGVQGPELEAIRGELAEAQRLVAEAAPPQEKPAQPAPGSQQAAEASAPAPAPVKRAPSEMSDADWADLARRFPDMPLQEQFSTNKRLGPQGRRKLASIIKGEKGGVFIVPGATVQIVKNPLFLRASFRRFKNDRVNGYSDAKFQRRGQDCRIRATFQDGTLTCEFPDGTKFDFPWEAIEGYNPDGSSFV